MTSSLYITSTSVFNQMLGGLNSVLAKADAQKRFSGHSYLLNYGLPHFFFHVTTAYAVLRHNGVEVGKKDYIGTY
jgi:hypothetical protein